MAGAQEVIMIFRCQDVSLALCVLMCTFKTLQLTTSALRERKGEGEEAGRREKRKRAIRLIEGRQVPPPPFISKQVLKISSKLKGGGRHWIKLREALKSVPQLNQRLSRPGALLRAGLLLLPPTTSRVVSPAIHFLHTFQPLPTDVQFPRYSEEEDAESDLTLTPACHRSDFLHSRFPYSPSLLQPH